MIARIAWLPALGTWTLYGSKDPFDPSDGRMAFHKGSPSSAPPGEPHGGGTELAPPPAEMEALLECASLCNIASVFQERANDEDGSEKSEPGMVWAARGDPTEMWESSLYLLSC